MLKLGDHVYSRATAKLCKQPPKPNVLVAYDILSVH